MVAWKPCQYVKVGIGPDHITLIDVFGIRMQKVKRLRVGCALILSRDLGSQQFLL